MKNLELNEMENINGGAFRWQCAWLAVGIGVSIADGMWALAAYAAYEFAELGCHND